MASRRAADGWILAWAVGLVLAVIVVGGDITAKPPPTEAAAAAGTSIDTLPGTLPPAASLPTEQSCAQVARQSGVDHARPEQVARRTPAVAPWPDFWEAPAEQFRSRITGGFTGSTDQSIVWAACKWGINVDVVRGWAWAERVWRRTQVGSLLDSEPRTAFDLDYGLASVRGCYEGWVTYLKVYGAGDLSGCLGWHHSGQWRDNAALAYIGQVQKWVDERPWTHARAP